MSSVVTERANGTRRVQVAPDGDSMTEQSHGDAVNINTIMRKARRQGYIPTFGRFPNYGDFSKTGTYQEALDQCIAAQERFMELPASVRKRFRNDPGELIHFLSDPGNVDEAVELGLVQAPACADPKVGESSVPDLKPAEKPEPASPA